MFSSFSLRILSNYGKWRRCFCSKVNLNPNFIYSNEVQNAIENARPLVALESTIITHGLPYPQNIEMALNVEKKIREEGAIPATIAILGGQIHIGLEEKSLKNLAQNTKDVIKVSRRDLPYVLSQKRSGGTTVSGTMILAHLAGISIFATGGVGGVHRGAETTWDVSADLTELGRTPMTVVSSGVKSILDIGLTLEYLETQGVCVAVFRPDGKDMFPAFFSRESVGGHRTHCSVETPQQAAKLIRARESLHLQSGILLAVPVPEKDAIPADEMEEVIERALTEADSSGVHGKQVTPFLLARIAQITQGRSITTNLALVENNARTAAQVACALTEQQTEKKNKFIRRPLNSPKRPVVIGGSNSDTVVKLRDDLKVDGSSLDATTSEPLGGGVARNVADCLGRLGADPLLITMIGEDSKGRALRQSLGHLDHSGIITSSERSTAWYSAILDMNGECRLGFGDFSIHDLITPQMVASFADEIQKSLYVFMDGNIPVETIEFVLELCRNVNIPVWYEPTNSTKASKPFNKNLQAPLWFISPNYDELCIIANELGINVNENQMTEDRLQNSYHVAKQLLPFVDNIMVTLGKLGLIIVNRKNVETPIINRQQEQIHCRYYPAKSIPQIVSVSGAGDCLAAGFLARLSTNNAASEAACVSSGLVCAEASLLSLEAVPVNLPEKGQLTGFADFRDISS